MPAKSEELLEILRKGKTFAEELLRENERLRVKVASLEDARDGGDAAALRAENERLRERVEQLERRFTNIESENQDFARRYVEVERQNEALANLYVASYQLHATLAPAEVAAAIADIIVGLVGAAEYALLLVDEEARELVVVTGEGAERRFPRGRAPLSEGLEGRVAMSGAAVYGEAGDGQGVACVPLMLMGECVGVIAIYRLLSQKQGGLTAVDHELLGLLAGQAAAALVSSRLYAASRR